MRDAFSRTLYALARQRPNVYLVVADISPAASMDDFRRDFPDQFINVGVAEQSMIGVAAGLAMRGCTVFCYTIATFALYRPFEQIRVDLCYQNLPVTVVGVAGGLAYSTLGGTHHATEDIAVMSALPNMSILAPCDPAETEAAVWACSEQKGPIYLRLGKSGEPTLTEEDEPFVFGKIRCIWDGGDDETCILTYGPIAALAIEVAQAFGKPFGPTPNVCSVHTLKPLDVAGIGRLLTEYRTVIVLEEHSVVGGLSSMVKAIAWDAGFRDRLLTFGLQDKFIHVYGTQRELWAAHGLTAANIMKAI